MDGNNIVEAFRDAKLIDKKDGLAFVEDAALRSTLGGGNRNDMSASTTSPTTGWPLVTPDF